MRKIILLLTILATFLTSCQKFDPIVDGEGTQVENPITGNLITNMSDLVIGNGFDWSLIKTLDVQVTLPEEDKDRILHIYSQDGQRLYYKGHPEDGSNVLQTKVTVPTYESVLFLKYGVGENYPEVGTYLSGNTMNFDLSSNYKEAFKTGGDPCTGCEAKLKNLTLKYNGSGTVNVIVYNEKGNKAGPGKEELYNGSVSNGQTFNFSKSDQFKSEITVFVNGSKHVPIHVSCSQPLYVGQVHGLFEITAGVDKNGGTLGSCDNGGGGDPPDFDCLTMWALDDNNPGNLYYITLNDNPVQVYTEGDIDGLNDSEDMESLAIDDNGDMYFINVSNGSKLYKIPFSEVDKNPSTKVNAQYIGNTGVADNSTSKITNLTFIGDDLYGIGVKSEKVYQINTSNGAATQVGTLGYDGTFKTSGLTEGVDGTIYLLFTKENLSELWKFNSFPNGGITKVMTIAGSKKVESLAAHPNGYLYAADDYKFFKLDPDPSQLTTEVLVNYSSDIEGIDFYWDDELDCVEDPDPDPEDPCEDDGDYDSASFGWFTFEYLGVQENIDGTSTWSYRVRGNAPEDGPVYKDLSHWVLELCEGTHVVDSADPSSDMEVGTDPTLNFYGIKWDKEIDKLTGDMTFSFTLDDQYDVVPVTVGFKAGQNLHYCEIYGPSCEGDPDPDPDPEVYGNIAFEDLWPGKGDYDLNDLVIEYDFDITKDNNEYVESIEATFLVRCFGANLHNAFGFTFPNVDPSDIVSVTGYDIENTASFVLNANGTEAGQSKATFILYDDTYRLMQHPGSGTGVNTEHPHPYVTPVTLTMNIVFANQAVTYSQLDIGNFNPFIVKHQERGVEIHLPNYPPTDLVDESHYQTFDDDTNPPSKYYLTENNLPWAILIPDRFDYPVEFQSILGAYNHFATWAQSANGSAYPDWYKDEPGYRNASVIYQTP